MSQVDVKLRELREPSKENLLILSDYLNKIYLENCLNQEEINERFELFFKIKSNFLLKYPGMSFPVTSPISLKM